MEHEYIDKKIVRILESEPRGALLDVPCGEGRFSEKARKMGFDVTAGDIIYSESTPEDFKYIDLNNPLPFPDEYFNAIICIEGIEHLENHFLVIREFSRILKPGGLMILSTPNVLSLESRWKFFWTGYHDMASRPINDSLENLYMEHVNLAPFNSLEFLFRINQFEIQTIEASSYRKGSLFFMLLYPFIWLFTRLTVLHEKEQVQRNKNKKLLPFLLSPKLLAGMILIIAARKKSI